MWQKVGKKQKNVQITYPEGVRVVPQKTLWQYIISNKWLYILLIPGLLYLLIYNYLPMFGIVIAFQKFNMVQGIFHSKFIGFDNFKLLFQEPRFYEVFANSVILSFYNLIFGFPMPIILAVLLNEIKQDIFKRFVQTVSYLPYFISWVVVSGMLLNYLSQSNGMVNFIIEKLGGEKLPFLMDPKYFRGIMVIANMWKGAGWGSIIYLAAMSNLDQQVYEAALIDGANRFQRMRYITIPGIMSTIITVLILNMGSIMNNGFEQIFMLQNSLNLEVSEVFETYTYKQGLMLGNFGYSTAVGLFKSLVSFVLVMFTNFIARRVGEKGLW